MADQPQIPGTTLFDGRQARKGYALNSMCFSFNELANRQAFLADDAPPPLAQLAPERTLYVSGLSKNIATGLRVGYLTAPAVWVAALERSIRASTARPPDCPCPSMASR